MREVYYSMCELRKMPLILKFDTCSDVPEWIRVLRTAFEKFEIMKKWLSYDDTCKPKLSRYACLIACCTDPQQNDILKFSDEIFRCQAYFPGPTVLCEHALLAWQHLNIICMHCRTYQMHILIKKASFRPDSDSGSSSDSDNEESAATETRLLVVTQRKQVKATNPGDDGVIHAEIVRQPPTNPNVDTTDAPPPYPDKERKSKAPGAPDVPGAYSWSTNNKAKLEVQGLLQRLQRAAC